MKLLNKAFAKTIAATTAAGAMAVSAVPAYANEHHRDKIGAGEIIAGAVVIGGLAAILASKKDKRHHDVKYDRGYNHNYRSRGFNNNRFKRQRVGFHRNGSRNAINQCVRQTEHKASYLGYADVTNIRDIKRTRYGYRIKGNILVTKGNGYKKYSDHGRFTCYVDSGKVSEVKLRGLR